ncbi:uncharacterized protein LOC121383920 [Gigantopelta aegis]|uniref:uncharacterized protein LOC121383920 n=1 Tax=Gigantopelta aegis TaxID=1735272 RepID=UPI001B88760C|nr:uncharacterized protein LOC121383920 [Gigantopelta aegis]
MGIGIQQWRMKVGSFQPRSRILASRMKTICIPVLRTIRILMVIMALLIISGDVEKNPGPDCNEPTKQFTTKKRYNAYVNQEDPWISVPKTSKWRLKRAKTNTVQNIQRSDNTDQSCTLAVGIESNTTHGSSTSIGPAVFSNSIMHVAAEDQEDSFMDDATCQPATEVDWWCPNEQVENTDDGGINWYDGADSEHLLWYDCEDQNLNEPTTDEEMYKRQDDSEMDDSLIYDGASITVGQSALLILSFVFKHCLTGECLADLLKLVSLHCLKALSVHSSLYKFRKYFCELKTCLTFHKYCKKCEYLLSHSDEACPVCNLTVDDSTSFFVEIPVEDQIKELFKRKTFHDQILHRFHRNKTQEENIEDIFDGQLYKEFSRTHFHSKNNISLMWYTDGVPLFKSSKISLWPLYLSINELPYKERVKPENLLFAGLWYGRSKPSMATFLKPFHETLAAWKNKGVEVDCSHCDKTFVNKAVLLCGTCDLPAKCMMLNMTQFNGKYGCPRCMQPGEVVQTGNGHTQIFPFHEGNVDGPLRSHDQFIGHGEQALKTKTIIYGIKGPSWLTDITFDSVRGTAIDYMHTVLLGLVRRLLTLWFDPQFSNKTIFLIKICTCCRQKTNFH